MDSKKEKDINKRIDFDKKTFLLLETMMPTYSLELGDNVKDSSILSFIVADAIKSLYINEYQEKLKNLAN